MKGTGYPLPPKEQQYPSSTSSTIIDFRQSLQPFNPIMLCATLTFFLFRKIQLASLSLTTGMKKDKCVKWGLLLERRFSIVQFI